MMVYAGAHQSTSRLFERNVESAVPRSASVPWGWYAVAQEEIGDK